MEEREIQLYLSRILSGYYVFVCDNETYKIKYPDNNLKYEAEAVAYQEFYKNRFEEWLTKERAVSILTHNGLWSKESEHFLEKSEKIVEDLKVAIFQNFKNPSTLKEIRKRLNSHKKTEARLLNTKHQYDHATLEGYCEAIKNEYLLRRSIYKNDHLVFLDENEDKKFDSVSSFISRTAILPSQFRKLARSPQWGSYWHSKEAGDIFNTSIVDWTDEQRTLAMMTRMYDNAREHPESPSEEIFEDDDAFDGWAIFERRKQDKEKSQTRNTKMLPGNLSKAGEVFVMASNQDDASEIMSLNDERSKSIIKERKQFLQKVGTATEINLPDVQRDLIINSANNKPPGKMGRA